VRRRGRAAMLGAVLVVARKISPTSVVLWTLEVKELKGLAGCHHGG